MDMSTQSEVLALSIRGASKVYRTYPTPRHRLAELLLPGRRYSREIRALDQVSIDLPRGGRLGIVGENGSGKSTLLKLIARVLTPTSGSVEVSGRVSALLELGAGFNAELTGRENIGQFCALHGMNRDEAAEALPQILAFSELRDAIEQPVKTYSSGMAVRLGFSCAVYVRPDILIIDEALSVGDAYFQNKCLSKVRAMLDDGATFIYVTHAADSIRSLCKTGLWLEKGRVRRIGSSREVGAAYQREVFSRLAGDHAQPQRSDARGSAGGLTPELNGAALEPARQAAFAERVAPLRTGSGEIRIDDISILRADRSESDSVDVQEHLAIRVVFHVEKPIERRCALGVGITDLSGREIFHFSSADHDLYPSDVPPGVPTMIEFAFDNTLCPGEFGLIAGIAVLEPHPVHRSQSLTTHVIDYCVGGARFSVAHPPEGSKDLWGLVHVDAVAAMTQLN